MQEKNEMIYLLNFCRYMYNMLTILFVFAEENWFNRHFSKPYVYSVSTQNLPVYRKNAFYHT